MKSFSYLQTSVEFRVMNIGIYMPARLLKFLNSTAESLESFDNYH